MSEETTLYMVVDIGCLCCSADSRLVGVYTHKRVAELVGTLAGTTAMHSRVRNHGESNDVVIFELNLPAMLNKTNAAYYEHIEVAAACMKEDDKKTPPDGGIRGWQELWTSDQEDEK